MAFLKRVSSSWQDVWEAELNRYSRTAVVLTGVGHLFVLWAGEFHPQRKIQTTFVCFSWSALIKPHQVFPEEITMLHLPQLLILSMNDELTCSRTIKQMLRDANSALLLWNNNNHIQILIVLNNIFCNKLSWLNSALSSEAPLWNYVCFQVISLLRRWVFLPFMKSVLVKQRH